jgi:Uma2 family endonuclease
MSAVEASSAVAGQARVWPLSVKAYHALGELGLIPERMELLCGQVFHRRSKSPLHSALVGRLFRLLRQSSPAGCFISQSQPITCTDSEPEPDLAVMRGREEDFWSEHPHTAELVIEVCVTSHDFDRSRLQAYASAGLKECGLILAPEKKIEVHRQPAGDRYAERQMSGPGGRLVSSAVPEIAVELDALFER